MRLKLKTAPTVEPVTLEETRLHCKVDGAADNALITSLIIAARQQAEKETHRAFITQTWQLFYDAAPHVIELPYPPLQSVVSIKVIDDEGVEAVVDSSNYIVDASENSRGRVRPNIGLIWPYHRGFASFIVEYKAGYGDAASDVDENLKHAIREIIATFYEERQAGALTEAHKSLLWPFKILRI